MQTQINFPIRKRAIRKNDCKENIKEHYDYKCNQGDDLLNGYNSILQRNKLAFTTSNKNVHVVGREKEQNCAQTFINNHLNAKQSGILYICGPPGTGKTLTINYVLEELKLKTNLLNLNCMTISKSSEILCKINKWVYQQKSRNKKTSRTNKMNIIILDEIDQLKVKNDETVIKIFQLAVDHTNPMLIIGISNTINMVDNLLPKLKRFSITHPYIIEFLPYSATEIHSILCERLQQVGCKQDEILLEPSAIQLCAKKVAGITGDIRMALDVCRKSLDALENSEFSVFKNKTNICETNSCDNEHRKVSALEICQILPHQYNLNFPTLSINQKFILAAIVPLFKKTSIKFVTTNKAYQSYIDNCRKYNFNPITFQDFLTSCEMLEDHKILKILKQSSVIKIFICLPINQVEILLQDSGILSTMMQNF